MSAVAAYNTVVSISTDDVTYHNITDIKSFAGPLTAADLDVTSFGDGQWKRRIQGLKEIMIKLDGQWDTATAQVDIRDAFDSGDDVYVKVLFDGTNGYKVACMVTDYEAAAAVDGLVTFTASLASNGAPTFLP